MSLKALQLRNLKFEFLCYTKVIQMFSYLLHWSQTKQARWKTSCRALRTQSCAWITLSQEAHFVPNCLQSFSFPCLFSFFSVLIDRQRTTRLANPLRTSFRRQESRGGGGPSAIRPFRRSPCNPFFGHRFDPQVFVTEGRSLANYPRILLCLSDN